MTENNTLDILKSALLLERKGQVFYQAVSDRTDSLSVKHFFEFMANEETKHIEMLSQHFKSYKTDGTFLPNNHKDTHNEVELSVLTKEIKEKVFAAGFEAAAISAAMSMEQRAIKLYANRAASTMDADERALYEWLAEWERSHLRLLDAMDKELTDKIWYDNHFWPF